MTLKKTDKVHFRDKIWEYPRGLCGYNRYRNWDNDATQLTNNVNQVTCKSCLDIHQKNLATCYRTLRSAITGGLLTKEEYMMYWDKVIVEDIMDT